MKLKKLTKIIYWLFVIIIATITLSISLSVINPKIGIFISAVKSGSMEPKIQTGSAVIVVRQNNYHLGDIVTYQDKNPQVNKYTTTHRIVEQGTTDKGNYFFTKGDANPEKDTDPVEQGQIVGKVIVTMPLIGYLINFARTQYGIIFLVIIPTTLIVITEILNIKNEILHLLKRRVSYS